MKQADVKSFLDDPEPFLARIIDESDTGNTGKINRTRIMSEVYLAHTLKKTGIAIEDELLKAASILQGALAAHSESLSKHAEAARKHTMGLMLATWVLVFATIGLIIATAIQ